MKKYDKKTIEQVIQLESLCTELLEQGELTHGMDRSLRNLRKEILLFKNHTLTTKVDIDYEGKKLQIGGGKHLLKDFVNLDAFPPADIIFDVREGLPFKDSSIPYIFTEHFMEHIDYPVSVKNFISETFRVLKPGGEIVIGVPDSELIINGYATKDKNLFNEMMERWYKNRNCKEHFNTYIDLVNYHFRDQDDDEKYNPHFWGYDFEKLQNLLVSAGFIDVKRWEFDNTIANPKREFGSIYVTAKK